VAENYTNSEKHILSSVSVTLFGHWWQKKTINLRNPINLCIHYRLKVNYFMKLDAKTQNSDSQLFSLLLRENHSAQLNRLSSEWNSQSKFYWNSNVSFTRANN